MIISTCMSTACVAVEPGFQCGTFPDGSNCTALVVPYLSSDGLTCAEVAANGLCSNKTDASQACCGCGGGTDGGQGVCEDHGMNWTDTGGDACEYWGKACADAWQPWLFPYAIGPETVCCECGGGSPLLEDPPAACTEQYLTLWSEWTYECSNACDGGVQTRHRSLIPDAPAEMACTISMNDTRPCREQPCVDADLGPGYVGCISWAETELDEPLLETLADMYSTYKRWVAPAVAMTIPECVAFCARSGMAYAGLQDSNMCWCPTAKQLGNLTDLGQHACQQPCLGNTSQLCGDVSTISVYQVVKELPADNVFEVSCGGSAILLALYLGADVGKLRWIMPFCSDVLPLSPDLLIQDAPNVSDVEAAGDLANLLNSDPTVLRPALERLGLTLQVAAECSLDVAQPTGLKVAMTISSTPYNITGLTLLCATGVGDRSELLGTNSSVVSYFCDEGHYIWEWLCYTWIGGGGVPFISVQAHCSDGAYSPLLGYFGQDFRLTRKGPTPDAAQSVTMAVSPDVASVLEFVGLYNNYSYPNGLPKQAVQKEFMCAGPFLRVVGVDALIGYIIGNIFGLMDLQVHCAPVLCPPGTTGDGLNCLPVDECALGLAVCDEHATCIDTGTGYSCQCNAGFEGTGDVCLQAQSVSVGLIVGVVAAFLSVIAITVFIVWWLLRKQRSKSRELQNTLASIKKRAVLLDHGSPDAIALLQRVADQDGLLERDQFTLLEKLGSGVFGTVHKGVVFHGNHATLCAVKTLHATANASSTNEFAAECGVLRLAQHHNVVRMLGVCAADRVYLLMELCPGGSLLDTLRHTPDMSANHRLWLASQTAHGFAYLSSVGIVHRDIAARNILLGNPAADSYGWPVPKISDFGMARVTCGAEDVYVMTAGRGETPLPVRWMAPEAIKDRTFSEASDVWSFAVLLWEIYSDGALPYGSLRNHELLMTLLRNDVLVHPQPPACPATVYSLMQRAWSQDPANRLGFACIAEQLDALWCVTGLPQFMVVGPKSKTLQPSPLPMWSAVTLDTSLRSPDTAIIR